jgi:large subunit ribosomal protein L13
MKTVYVNPKDIDRKWYVIDAADQPLGRVAAKAAEVLRGKNKPEYVPHHEIGDYVIIVNAGGVQLTGRKKQQKIYYRHSGYLGSLKAEPFHKLIRRRPEIPVERAVRGMLPKNRLGRKLFRNLKVYGGPDHPHAAQKPESITVSRLGEGK